MAFTACIAVAVTLRRNRAALHGSREAFGDAVIGAAANAVPSAALARHACAARW